MSKRHFVMKAHDYCPKVHIGGWFASEKLDGKRCFWDGGISRGLPKSEVPWANCEKDERYSEEQVSTGLWSTYGNVIHAPDPWLDDLLKTPLDGELYIKGYRQDMMSITTQLVPDKSAWDMVNYNIFDSPNLLEVFKDGVINVPNFNKEFKDIHVWLIMRPFEFDKVFSATTMFMSKYKVLGKLIHSSKTPNLILHPQFQLSFSNTLAFKQAEAMLDKITDEGGEGVMLRKPESTWIGERSYDLLKLKKYKDAEAKVVGYTTGRRTDKGSKLLGLMGAMIVDWNGVRFELSGFTDAERELAWNPHTFISKAGELNNSCKYGTPFDWACDHPETECPPNIVAKQFLRHSKITFRYRDTTKDGKPQEASYWRKTDGTN